jgi:uncharacterized Rossmann fold enzyme
VKYDEWESIYHEICEYFSFDPAEDERAAHIAAGLSDADASAELRSRINGQQVTVCGNAPCLKDEIGKVSGVTIAADAAASVLISAAIKPDIIVTDLDGIDEYAIDLNRTGTILVVHAHGDNIARLYAWIPRIKGPLIITTQGRPFLNIRNYGGFTDGDRAVFMAKECGASRISIIGFDCDDPDVLPMKKGKLNWARRLLAMIGYDI